jgi:hypothetical protein
MDRQADIFEETNQAGMSFLLTELDTALTFLSVAETTRNGDSALRNRENARVAYQSALHYQGRVRFDEEEKVSFEDKVSEVKRALLAVGILV